MLRQILAIFLTLTLSFTTVACGPSNQTQAPSGTNFSNNTSIGNNNIANGKYPVQQATYNDVDGEYSLMLLNTPAGSTPFFRTTNLQMARLTDEEIKNGETTYAEIKGNEAVMHLTPDFRIEYVHNVTENQTNPNGQLETVVVRRESSFWTPFAGALAGQALGSLLFTPQYYVPPMYQTGGVLTGYGGYGRSYTQAVDSYRSSYNSAPAVEKNRQAFRTTGTLKKSQTGSSQAITKNKSTSTSTKATGSGFGSSNLKTTGSSKATDKKSTTSFGSSKRSSSFRAPTRTRSFGTRRRR